MRAVPPAHRRPARSLIRTSAALLCATVALAGVLPAHAADASTATTAKTPGVQRAAATAADRTFDRLSHEFIEALWKLDPDAALIAGRYDGAARLPAPTAASRAQALAFSQQWQSRFGAIKPEGLSDRARTDLALLQNKLASDIWALQTLREFAWNPSNYNVAGAMDLILNTDYAPRSLRLKALLSRLKAVPAYYEAAHANIETPTREHTQLAVSQI
jgi:hypothetical protein